MLLPPLRGLLPLHFGELLILLGQPQRHVTYISVTPHPLCFCCTPSAKHNSMSKPTRVCPFLWTALGTNMVAKRFFPPLKLNYQPYETLERDERDGRFFKMAECSEVGKKMGKWSPITLQIWMQSPSGHKGTFKTRRPSWENRTQHLYLKRFQLEKKRPQPCF